MQRDKTDGVVPPCGDREMVRVFLFRHHSNSPIVTHRSVEMSDQCMVGHFLQVT